ncbi:MAG: hypothetical protein IKI07_03770, partial [Prevotella sp.]|nr:hypothetical protein [Prevotella sp.]
EILTNYLVGVDWLWRYSLRVKYCLCRLGNIFCAPLDVGCLVLCVRCWVMWIGAVIDESVDGECGDDDKHHRYYPAADLYEVKSLHSFLPS